MLNKKQKVMIAILLLLCFFIGLGIGSAIHKQKDTTKESSDIQTEGCTQNSENAAPSTEESDMDETNTESASNTESGSVTDLPNESIGETVTEENGTDTEESLTEGTVTDTEESNTEEITVTTEGVDTATDTEDKVNTPAVTKTPVTPAPTKTPTKAPTKVPTKVPTAKPTESVPKPVKPESGTPVGNHGQLSVKGTSIVDKNGKPYQIQGVSTHGIAWFPKFVNKETFKYLRDDWGVNCIRLAMYTAEYHGYCTDGNKDELKKLVCNGVDYATSLGMYVIIDWHILQDLTPQKYMGEAIKFFDEMSRKYAGNNNVIYEICNEPNGGTQWKDIKSYAEEVIAVIRKNDKNAIIIVGTPTWSQDVDVAANDPIKGQTNIMYALHFYAGTHKTDLQNKYKTAISKGLPIFVTEFGITDASGNGACDEASANTWISLLQKNHTAYCIWNLANKNETSSLIKENCTKLYGFTENDLSQEGKWYVKLLGGKLKLPETNNTSGNTGNNNTGNTNGNTGGDNGNNTGTQDTPKPINFSQNGITATAASGWNENGMCGYTIQFNMRGKDVAGKKIVITFTGTVKIKTANDCWGGKATASGSIVTVTNTESWFGGMNVLLAPGATIKSIVIQ